LFSVKPRQATQRPIRSYGWLSSGADVHLGTHRARLRGSLEMTLINQDIPIKARTNALNDP
jgi:hypothetical protein